MQRNENIVKLRVTEKEIKEVFPEIVRAKIFLRRERKRKLTSLAELSTKVLFWLSIPTITKFADVGPPLLPQPPSVIHLVQPNTEQPVKPPVPPQQSVVPLVQPVVHTVSPAQPGPAAQLYWSHFKPEFVGKPDDAKQRCSILLYYFINCLYTSLPLSGYVPN